MAVRRPAPAATLVLDGGVRQPGQGEAVRGAPRRPSLTRAPPRPDAASSTTPQRHDCCAELLKHEAAADVKSIRNKIRRKICAVTSALRRRLPAVPGSSTGADGRTTTAR